MEYITSFDYEKYSIDKSLIEEWLTELYKNSLLECDRRAEKYKKLIDKSDKKEVFNYRYKDQYDDIRKENKEVLPTMIKTIDKYLFFLIEMGYVNSNNFSSIFTIIKNNVEKVVPAIETHSSLSYFRKSTMDVDDSKDFSFQYSMPSIIDENKTLKVLHEITSEKPMFDCISDSLTFLLLDKINSNTISYYERVKKELSGYQIDPDKFDLNIHNAFEYIYYCMYYEMKEDKDSYNYNVLRDKKHKYKSVLLGGQDNTDSYSIQDEIREVMALFIETDPTIYKPGKATSDSINEFTKKLLEGNYFENRCQGMTKEDKDDLFMSLYHLGTLYFIVSFTGIKENTELAITNVNNLEKSVDKVKNNTDKGKNKNG